MNGTTLERPDVAAYLDAVRAQLADLPAEERDDLVADVEASLLESGEPPTLSPEEFAAELREAAGLSPAAQAAVQGSPLDSLREWLTSDRVASWRATASELAPIWWLARAYVVVVLLKIFSGLSFDGSVVALAVAGAISVWLGLRGRRRQRPYPRLGLAVNIALALALLPSAVFFSPLAQFGQPGALPAGYAEAVPAGLALDGRPIRNVYPYTRAGEPLFDVLLYDEAGGPIDLRSGPDDTSRRVLVTEDGEQLFNSFPIRYFEPGTATVARPELGPPVKVPKVVSPPLGLPR